MDKREEKIGLQVLDVIERLIKGKKVQFIHFKVDAENIFLLFFCRNLLKTFGEIKTWEDIRITRFIP